jgi:hypothetical protein
MDTKRKFEAFTNQELNELLLAFQSCDRDNRVARRLFSDLEKEIDGRD